MTYAEAIKAACNAASGQDYAASAAWLDIAREIRLGTTPPKPTPTGQGTVRKPPPNEQRAVPKGV